MCIEVLQSAVRWCFMNVCLAFSSVTPDQWASFSNENILKAEREQNASATLRGVIDGVLEQTKQDIERQRATVNLAFQKRIQETSEAKESLEQHLDKVSNHWSVYMHTVRLDGRIQNFGLRCSSLAMLCSGPLQQIAHSCMYM